MGTIAALVIGLIGKLLAGLFASIGVKRYAEQTGRLKERLETSEDTRAAEQTVAKEVATERTTGEVISDLENDRF